MLLKTLEKFHQRCLRRIMNIKWYDRVSNVKVLRNANIPCVEALLTNSQLRWSGHLVRMAEDRLPKQLFYSELTGGHRGRGRPKLRYKDTLKKSLQKSNISTTQWETMAKTRSVWRRAVRTGTKAFDQTRQVNHEKKRETIKERALTVERSVCCPLCDRLCASEFGLRSHMRVHR